jgi:hypothetical protein
MASSQRSQLSYIEHQESSEHVSGVRSKKWNASKPSYEHIEGDALLVDQDGNVRRLPIPSDNPNDPFDPLNYRAWEKAAIIFCCCWFCKATSRFFSLAKLLTFADWCVGSRLERKD